MYCLYSVSHSVYCQCHCVVIDHVIVKRRRITSSSSLAPNNVTDN